MSEPAIFLVMLLIVGHVASVYFITHAQEKTIEECRKVILEREETERIYYADGPNSHTEEEPQSLEVI